MTSQPVIAWTDFGGPADAPLLVLGPSLGTSVTAMWSEAAGRLSGRMHVVGWDLPGHGRSSPATAFRMTDLAAGVLKLSDNVARGRPFHYAGDSIGGAVGLQLLLDAPERVLSAALLCTGATIGTPQDWAARAATVRASGTGAVVDLARRRWFSADFPARRPNVAAALLDALRDTDDESYAQACEALAEFDVTERLSEIIAPVLAIAGARDVVTPPEGLQRIASGVKYGRLVIIDDCAHLAPAEAPYRVADLVAEHVRPDAYSAGMAVRREVLGDAHVDNAISATTEFSADFQDLIVRYAWGTIWTRPGLDRRSRSLITLTALVARGHHEELAMHLRAARRIGLSNQEISELLLQTAIYCGVPDANTAFRIANRVLAECDETDR